MKIIYVDDERSAHINLQYDLKNREDVVSLDCFTKADLAIEHAKCHSVDCAFLDIDLGGGTSGIHLAEALKEIHPYMEVVFVTAYDEYARDCYRVGGRAYLTKPYTQEELDDTLRMMKKLTVTHKNEEQSTPQPKDGTVIKTFGNFDLLVNHQPVAFKNAKAKELLAFLVHQRGGTVNSSQVFIALWERQEYTATTSTYVRRTARALKEELDALGIGDIFVIKRNCYSVDVSLFLCDYYQLMAGNITEASQYNGEYMNQYSWGESTIPLIDRKATTLTQKD